MLTSGCREYSARAKVRVFPYGYRHSLATHLLEHGMPAEEVAGILGNTVAVLKRHYAHLLADHGKRRGMIAAVRGGSGGNPTDTHVLPMQRKQA
jgi:integrase